MHTNLISSQDTKSVIGNKFKVGVLQSGEMNVKSDMEKPSTSNQPGKRNTAKK